MSVTVEDVRTARDRIRETDIVRQTPVKRSRSLSQRLDASVHLKMEHVQRTGSFKLRGAYNKLRALRESEEVDHVIAASAGNHAQGVALAAAKMGFESTIVMLKSAPQAKIDATRGYGATVKLHGQDFQAAQSHAKSLDTSESVFVHAYDDPRIVAGQGTTGLEINEQVAGLDTVVVPIGGGGLTGGSARVSAHSHHQSVSSVSNPKAGQPSRIVSRRGGPATGTRSRRSLTGSRRAGSRTSRID